MGFYGLAAQQHYTTFKRAVFLKGDNKGAMYMYLVRYSLALSQGRGTISLPYTRDGLNCILSSVRLFGWVLQSLKPFARLATNRPRRQDQQVVHQAKA